MPAPKIPSSQLQRVSGRIDMCGGSRGLLPRFSPWRRARLSWLLRRRRRPTCRRPPHTERRATGTGSSVPTAGSSTSAVPVLRVNRQHELQRPVIGIVTTPSRRPGTGSTPPTAASSASAKTQFYGSLPGLGSNRSVRACPTRSSSRWSGWCPATTTTATSWWRPTGESSLSATPSSKEAVTTSAAASGTALRCGHARRNRQRLLGGDVAGFGVRLRRRAVPGRAPGLRVRSPPPWRRPTARAT